jgi:hypothetical protein
MDTTTPPADDNRGPGLTAIYWTECAVALIVVTLRIYGRTIVGKIGPDDYMMLFTMVNAIPYTEQRFDVDFSVSSCCS